MGAYTVCPLPFQFLFAAFWNEALGVYEGF